jgi:hypothetical protein
MACKQMGCEQMALNDLTAPLRPGPRKRQGVITIPAAHIMAAALGLFLGLFVLWAVVADTPSGSGPMSSGPMAVVPADLHIAKKAPPIVAVPQPAPPADTAERAATPDVTPPPQTKPPGNVTVTIVDGKTGLKREVVVAAPPPPPAVADGMRLDQLNNIETTSEIGPKRTDRAKRSGAAPAR